jgi:hypothetical protein
MLLKSCGPFSGRTNASNLGFEDKLIFGKEKDCL